MLCGELADLFWGDMPVVQNTGHSSQGDSGVRDRGHVPE